MTPNRPFLVLVLALAVALVGCGGGGSGGPLPPPTPSPSTINVRDFLRTDICIDGSLAVLGGCASSSSASGTYPVLTWRYDWAHQDQAQIQNTYELDGGSGFVATFNYPPHGTFNAANGDGGDVYVVDGDRVRINYTQNGSGNGGTVAGWWIGTRCGGTGWISFDAYASDQGWRDVVARLKGSTNSPSDCLPLDSAYTRWLLIRQLPVYFILQDPSGTITTKTVPLDAIVSEHYAGPSMDVSAAMERQIHVAGVGPSVYWQSWIKNPPTAPPVYQCTGPAGWTDPPGPGWVLWDARCRTVVRQANPILTGDQWGWPPANATQ